MSAGAYGMSMSSNYNTRPRAAEVMVDGDQCHLIRERESLEQLTAQERILVRREYKPAYHREDAIMSRLHRAHPIRHYL